MLYSEIITKFKLINASPHIVISSFYKVPESILGHSSSVHSVSSDAFSGHSLYHLFFLRPRGILSIVSHACIMCVSWTRTHNTVGKSINSLGHWVTEQ